MNTASNRDGVTNSLKKSLTLYDVFSISTGAMFSSGFFLLPGLATAKAGPAAVLAYLLAGILILPAMFSKAELATAMPKAGGTYYFLDRSLAGLEIAARRVEAKYGFRCTSADAQAARIAARAAAFSPEETITCLSMT